MMGFTQIIRLLLLTIVSSFLLLACGGGGGSSSDNGHNVVPTSDDYMSNVYNGYALTSIKTYDASGNLLSTITYSINSTNKIMTRTSSTSGDIYYYYYNSNGEYIKLVKIDEIDTSPTGSYSTSSYENYYTYDTNGLLIERITDVSIDGDIDATQIWKYDSNGFLISTEFDSDNDGFIDITETNIWSNGLKLSSTRTESDGSSATTTFSYGNINFPSNSSTDRDDNGTVDSTAEYIVDSNLNLTLIRRYDPTGALVTYSIYMYQETGDEVIANKIHRDFYFF